MLMLQHIQRAHTLALIRRLEAYGPLPVVGRRQGRLQRQAQPEMLRMEYAAAIRPVCELARRALHGELPEILHLLRADRRERGKMDAFTDVARAKAAVAAVERASRAAVRAFDPTALKQIARRFGERTSDFQRGQIDVQVRQAMGVSIAGIEKPTRDKIEEFAARNVDLIKTVPERYFDRVRLDVEDAFAAGRHPDALSADLQDRFDMSEGDADRIARDQIGKLNAQVNQDRQEALGVEGYVWRGMMDGRERPEHVEREGVRFTWDDPPDGGHQGEDVQCRCYAEPDLAPLLGSGDEE